MFVPAFFWNDESRWLFHINRSTLAIDLVPPFHHNDTIYSLKDTATIIAVGIWYGLGNSYHRGTVISWLKTRLGGFSLLFW